MENFKKTVLEDVDNKLADKIAESDKSSEKRSRVKLRDGLNVFIMAPALGSMLEPTIFRYVHYNPFHVCGRGELLPDSKADEGLKENKNFRDCPRCITAWEGWLANDKPKDGPLKKAFASNMSSKKGVVQVIDVTGFFDHDQANDQATFNKKAYDNHFDQFVKTLYGEDSGEGLPVGLLNAAKAGVDTLMVNDKVGLSIRGIHRDQIIDLEGEDPLFLPDKYLLTIVQREGKAVKGEDEGSILKKSHTIKFTKPMLIKGWKASKELIDFLSSNAQDLNNITPRDETVQAKVDALHILTPEELDQYLSESGHTYGARDASPELEPSGPSAFSASGSSSPDAFGTDEDSVMTSKDKADIASLREKFKDA